MKLSQTYKDKLRGLTRYPEKAHGLYDELIERRLEELDPEYLTDLRSSVDTDSFWYA